MYIWLILIRFIESICHFSGIWLSVCLFYMLGYREEKFTLEKYLLNEFAEEPVRESHVIHSVICVCSGGLDGGSSTPASETQGWFYVEEGT